MCIVVKYRGVEEWYLGRLIISRCGFKSHPRNIIFVSRRTAAFVICGENKEFSLFVWDLKLGALCEFLLKAEGEHRESWPGGNRRQAVYQREIPPPRFACSWWI